jgi:hypothetical protein
MNIIQQIQQGIYELNILGCHDKDLIIAVSPLIETCLINHAAGELTLPVRSNQEADFVIKKLCGIEIYNKHPYNEILIYDVKRASLDERFIYRIEIGKLKKSTV